MRHHAALTAAALLFSLPAIERRAEGADPTEQKADALATADSAFLRQFEKDFEQGGSIAAKNFVPEAQMRGDLHTVRPLADNDGLNNTYYLDTASGVDAVTGTGALLVRIREIYALEYLRGLSKTEEFGKAFTKSAGAKVESVVGVVRDPIGTIKNVPKGASRFFGRIGESMKGGKSNEEEGGALAGITGVNKAKVQLAAKLGVSPYTTNEELSRELTNTAKAMAGGGLLISAATSLATGGAGTALGVVGVNQSLQDTLVNSTPEDLRIVNRKKLFALGMTRADADEFLMHPWYSPWHETIITEALTSIGADPSAYLAQACRALTPEDALYFQRLVQVLARYHATEAPIRFIRVANGVVCAIDQRGVLVVPLSCDYGLWAERAARRTEEFIVTVHSDSNLTGLALRVDGRVSQRLGEELTARKISVKAGVLGME